MTNTVDGPQSQRQSKALPQTRKTPPEVLAEPLTEGATFGNYHILTSLGSGDVEDVWLALLRRRDGEPVKVVLKTLLPDLSANPQIGLLALRESFLSAQINASGMARVFDCGLTDGRFYQGLEYIRGRNLRQILTQCRRCGETLPPWVVLRTAVALCHHLEEIQHSGEVAPEAFRRFHRRLVPERVLLTFEGEIRFLGCDLGLATAASRTGDTTRVDSLIDGLAPEWQPSMLFDETYDVFHIGALLFELLTDNPADVACARRQGLVAAEVPPPPLPSTMATWIPAELDQIILKALAVAPKDRHQSTAELGRELEAMLQHHGDNHGQPELGMLVSSLFPPSSPAARISNLDLHGWLTEGDDMAVVETLDRVEELFMGERPAADRASGAPSPQLQVCGREDGTTFAITGFPSENLERLLSCQDSVPVKNASHDKANAGGDLLVGPGASVTECCSAPEARCAGGSSWLKRLYRPLFGRRMRSSGAHQAISILTPPPSSGGAATPDHPMRRGGDLAAVPGPSAAPSKPRKADTVEQLWISANSSSANRGRGKTLLLESPDLPPLPERPTSHETLAPAPPADLDQRIAASWGTIPEVIQPDIPDDDDLAEPSTDDPASGPDIFKVLRPGHVRSKTAVSLPRPKADAETPNVAGPAPPSEEEAEAAQQFDLGLRELRHGEYQAARDAWRAAVRLHPGNRIYRSNLRRIAKLLDEPEEEPST